MYVSCSYNHWCSESTRSITYSDCVSVALGIQLAMHHARLYHIFLNYLINGKIFGKKVSKYKLRVLIFSTNFSEIFLILKRTELYIIRNVHWYSCKLPVILLRY